VLLAESGGARQIEELTQIYVKASRHRHLGHGPDPAQAFGGHRPDAVQPDDDARQYRQAGAGLCPVRGHSNVQGDRTMGIEEQPTQAFLDRLGLVFGFEPPRHHGYDAVGTIAAMLEEGQGLRRLGGNFAMATPDTPRTSRRCACDLTVHIATKLNRSHLVHGKDALILPTLGRTEIDLQGGGAGVTVEDSMSMVHISYGMNKPASPNLRRKRHRGRHGAGHAGQREDRLAALQRRLRAASATPSSKCSTIFDYNAARGQAGRLPPERGLARTRVEDGQRQGAIPRHAIELDTPIQRARQQYGERLMVLMTTRSHDQYNTTIYAMDDRYRGVFGQRRVVFINRDDLAMLGFAAGDWVDLIGVWHDGIERRADRFLLVEYDIPRGCIGAYYPETNPLVPLDSVGDGSGTPTSSPSPCCWPLLPERRVIVRSSNWLRMLFVWDGSVLQAIIPQLLLMLVISSLALLTDGRVFGVKIPLDTAPFPMVGISLAIFLGFRNNASYAALPRRGISGDNC
jgi:anaerobic selenocysteine-containing dehydrogenase